MTAAKKLTSPETYLESGLVERLGETISIRLYTGIVEARRAKSCLVAPEIGDKVLCAIEADGAYVLTVLAGAEGAKTVVTADGDLELRARGGSVAVVGTEGVNLVSGGDLGLTARSLNVTAKQGSVAIDELGFFGRLLQAEVTKVTLVAQEMDSVFTRLSQRAKRVFRFVEELDQTRAGTIDMRAQNLVAVRGENTIVSARVLAKIDGEQIHLG